MNVPILDAVKSQLAKLRPSDFVALAKATGVPEGTIRKIHYGEVSDPRIGTVQKLHDYFASRPGCQKANATKRAKYPHKFYAPGEPHVVRTDWQAYCQSAVQRAKAAGILPDLSTGEYGCADCGAVAVEYDHRDYSRPLDVEPVCRACNLKRGKAVYPSSGRYSFKRISRHDLRPDIYGPTEREAA